MGGGGPKTGCSVCQLAGFFLGRLVSLLDGWLFGLLDGWLIYWSFFLMGVGLYLKQSVGAYSPLCQSRSLSKSGVCPKAYLCCKSGPIDRKSLKKKHHAKEKQQTPNRRTPLPSNHAY